MGLCHSEEMSGPLTHQRSRSSVNPAQEHILQLSGPGELLHTPRIKPRALQSLRDLAHTHSSNVSPACCSLHPLYSCHPGAPAVPQTCQVLRAFVTAIPLGGITLSRVLPSCFPEHAIQKVVLFLLYFPCSLPWLLEFAVGWCPTRSWCSVILIA